MRNVRLSQACMRHLIAYGSGQVRLADFGVSKDLSETDGRARTMCGTTYDLAPEVFRDDGYIYSADWFSLGIIIHQLHTGFIPYPYPGTYQHIEAIMKEKRPRNSTELQAHPWLDKVPWVGIVAGTIDPPLKMSEQEIVEARFIETEVDHSKEFTTKPHLIDLFGDLLESF
ncbi:hypothetical protein CROQUDRAFT_96282 [Cronartium quercuum f. sp. fusiforme G11]|uniref:cAMP-dependent protein kinase n=1 Tax=Cronartium quercuum f. sp. fusiforme G11 TaxID=708437 RepID=A0A9P6NFT8_9BASI|nr:hypothetical protein CROQUDRAFT_96282 [Cronartium quercuum f. sp. fusiforme G11]